MLEQIPFGQLDQNFQNQFNFFYQEVVENPRPKMMHGKVQNGKMLADFVKIIV